MEKKMRYGSFLYIILKVKNNRIHLIDAKKRRKG